jgi:TolB-like protein
MKRGAVLPRQLTAILGIVLAAAVLTACATTVSFRVQRPPAWNTLGIQRLAVMPFTTTDNSALQRHTAALLTNESLSRIQATNHFTLVNAAEVARIRAANGDIGALADALFSGQVLSVSVHNSSSQEETRNRDGTVTRYTLYRRDVQMSFGFNLTRAGRGADMIGASSMTNLARSDVNRNRESLKPAETLVQEIITRNLRDIASYIAPYSVNVNRKLEKEPSRDRSIRQRVRDAEALVKARSYRSAQEIFAGIYRDTGSFAAAYNAALLMEVQGDLEGALAFMHSVHHVTGNPRAAGEIARLRRLIDDIGLLYAYALNLPQRDRVVALMVNTIPAILPGNPRVALFNNSRIERDLADMVINGIIEGFLSRRIEVIDRSNMALMEMERDYHLSGFVSDEDIMNIGNAAGANAFVLVSITGAGASRRLSLRVLDVERNTILYQSPQTDEMNL